jgi:putative FmdB family regulatory protein
MPLFEYRCRACGDRFERFVLGKTRPTCPVCESADVQKLLSVFAVAAGQTRREAAGDGPAACGTCGDPRGPGSCDLD